MKTVVILDSEIRELLLEQKTLHMAYEDDTYRDNGTMSVSVADKEAELHLTPHDLWDAEVGGSVIISDRAGQEVRIRCTYKGFDDPLAVTKAEGISLGYGH